jgi:site-specific recombinase XerD
MEIVYIFCESKKIRVPLFGYDKRLFSFFISRGGVWDRTLGEFTFDRNTSVERLYKAGPGVPLVMVSDQSPVPMRVFGFLNRPWEQTAFYEGLRPSMSSLAQPCSCKHDRGFAPFVNKGLRPSINNPKAERPFTVAERPVPAVPIVPLPPSESDKFPNHWEIKLETELRAVKYSRQTMLSYIYYNRFLCHYLQKFPEEVQAYDIKKFLAAVEQGRDYSAATMNQALSAIKFFYTRVLPKDIIEEQHRPRQDKRLPVVLSKEEIKKMFMLETNFKHRLLLMMVFASGLRVSEVVSLKKKDVDTSRQTIKILGKGRKERYSLVSDTVKMALEEYYSRYNIDGWLFSGADPGKHLSIRSAQHIFEHALKRAKIEKSASIHSLRHSFATHLLESGTDIRYIQELLGHASIVTTERYTHVARRKVLSITSPLDMIDKE